MSDLAVKVFMASNGLTDFDVAASIMYKYGLADDYIDFANRLEPLLDEEGQEAFASGAEFAQEMVSGLRFAVTKDAMDSPFVAGINTAMTEVTALLQAVVDGAHMTDEDREIEEIVRNHSPHDLTPDQVADTVAAFFGQTREPSAR